MACALQDMKHVHASDTERAPARALDTSLDSRRSIRLVPALLGSSGTRPPHTGRNRNFRNFTPCDSGCSDDFGFSVSPSASSLLRIPAMASASRPRHGCAMTMSSLYLS